MSYNVPDDWNLYYSNCSQCGRKTHASEDYRCDYCEAREERLEREAAVRTPCYTIYTTLYWEGASDTSRTETGYVDPQYYVFDDLTQAKDALDRMFEGEPTTDGMSKSFVDEEGSLVTYTIVKI